MPKQARAEVSATAQQRDDKSDVVLWLAVTACLFFSAAHVLCSSALPLFFVREAGLPGFAPGLAFSVKTATEIAIILATPVFLRHIRPLTGLLIAGLLGLCSFWMLANVTGIGSMIIGAALEGTYYGVFAGISLTYVQSFAKGRMARANALYVNSLFIGALAAGPSVGIIAQFASFQAAILAAGLPMLCALMFLTLTRRLQAQSQMDAA